MSLSIRQFTRYLMTGTFVGISAVLLREGIVTLLPADTPTYYIISVLFVYVVGMILSFLLQGVFTFHIRKVDRMRTMFGPFIIVALVGASSTSLLSLLFRYWMWFDMLFGKLGGSAAFAAATFTSSVVSYWMSARFVFKSNHCPKDLNSSTRILR